MNFILLKTILALVFAYFVGSLPLSLFVTHMQGMPDPRSYGSKNIGATNVGRKKFSMGFAVFILDTSKVFIAIALARFLMIHESFLPLIWSSTILGQTRSMFLKLKGGKGVSCFIAGIAILYPTWFLPLAVPGLSVLLLTSRVWVASIFAASLFLVFSLTLSTHYLLVNICIGLWIICMHADNFQHYQKHKKQASFIANFLSSKTWL